MKKIALGIIAVVLAFSSIAQTNNQKSSEHKEFHQGGKHFKGNKNFEKLNLTDGQKSQIKALNETFRQQMQELNKNKGISADEQKERRKTLIKEHRENINSILTPEQRKQAKQQFAKEHKGKMRGRRSEEMSKDQDLTPEQSEKITALNSGFRNKIKGIKQDTNLSHEEKKEQIKSLTKKHKSDMRALLTKDQKEQLKKSRKSSRGSEAVK